MLAVGYTAGWRVALKGTAWAIAALVVITGVLGPALLYYVPLAALKNSDRDFPNAVWIHMAAQSHLALRRTESDARRGLGVR